MICFSHDRLLQAGRRRDAPGRHTSLWSMCDRVVEVQPHKVVSL